MKKLLLLLCALLTLGGSTWAATYTITYGTTTGSFYNGSNAVVTSGWIAKWVSNEAGKPAVTLTASANNINAENGRMAPGTSKSCTYTLSVESGYRIAGFSLNCPTFGADVTVTPNGKSAVVAATGEKIVVNSCASSFVYSGSNSGRILADPNDGGSFTITVVDASDPTVNVTYSLYESDGTTLVNNDVVVQEVNSAVSVPSSLAGYTYYDYATSGTIGESDCTITVIRTLKSGVVISNSNLSNTKCYNITTNGRGAWVVPNEATAVTSTTNAGLAFLASDTKQQFAFILYEGNYYLYSVSQSKFISKSGNYTTLTEEPGNNVTLLTSTGSFSYPVVVAFQNGSYHAGISNGYNPAVITHYNSLSDDGNRAYITEAGDFDPTAALAALEEYFHPAAETVYANAIAQLEAYPYGTGLGQYSLVVESTDYTSQAATIIGGLKEQGYTAENLTNAQLMLAGTTINLPKANTFMRLKSNATGQYIGYAESGKQPLVDAANAGIYLYTADKNFVSYNQGRYLSAAIGNALTAVGTTGGVFNFYETAYSTPTYGTYRIRVADDANGSIIAWTDNYLNGWGAGDHERCEWVIEEVTSLPVTISAAGYATLYSPVALTIPSGVTAYVATDNDTYLSLTAVDGGIIPAETGVILAGAEGTYNFAITTGGSVGSNALTGTEVAIARPENSYILSTSGGTNVGFYKDGVQTIPGFKAYLPAGGVSPVKTFVFDETGIESVGSETKANGAIYTLAGQRVAKAQKGLYIVNGKKVLVK